MNLDKHYYQTPTGDKENETSNSIYNHTTYTKQTSGHKRSRSIHNERIREDKKQDGDGNQRRYIYTENTQQHAKIAIHTSKIEFDIIKVYTSYDEEEKLTKIMIYKTYNVKNYYIEGISQHESEEYKLHVTLRTRQEACESITRVLEESGITINNIENETFYLTEEEYTIYNNNYNERNDMMKLEITKYVKFYTWTERNMNQELEKINFNMGNAEGKIKVIKNIDGTFYKKTDDIKQILANHIISPVRFDKAIDLMKSEGIEQYLEIGPGKALTGFIKKS